MAVNSSEATTIMLQLSFALPQCSSGLLNPKAIAIWTGQFFAVGEGLSCALLDAKPYP